MTGDWTWDETLFAGAAPYYEAGRLPYAPRLAEALAAALGLDGTGRLLDAGCGPGTLTLRFAHLFEEAVGLDADAGMVAEAARLAAERGIMNVSWVRMRAEELPADLGTFRTATFGASFHWMDREKVARAVRGMLGEGGALVHVDNRHQDGTDPRVATTLPAPPEDAIAELGRRFLGPDRRAGQGVRNTSPGDEDAVFRVAGFVGPERIHVQDGRLLERTGEEMVASVFSRSNFAPHLFGDRLSEFEADLRRLLAEASPAGSFAVELPDNELKIWRPS